MSNELVKRTLSSIFLIPIVYFIIIDGGIILNLFIVFSLSIALYEWHKISKKKTYYYPGIIFLFFSFYTFYKINNFDSNSVIIFIVLLTCISTDIGGYIFGKLFNGPKLTSISPKKTYSGLIGGILVSIISLFFFFQITSIFSEKNNIHMNLYIIIILISLVSQIGDIIISYFKRLVKIKDTGKIIPGHGGLLDRIDGMIFAFPFSYIMVLTNLFQI